VAELLTTREALARLGWRSRSSLHRAERAGRISRAKTIRRRPLYRAADVENLIERRAGRAEARVVSQRLDDDLEDAELAAIRAELEKLAARGENLDGPRPLRLLASAIRRRLVLREARGDAVTTGEITELINLELRVHHAEAIERANARTRRPRG
jgi:hypothetical protein